MPSAMILKYDVYAFTMGCIGTRDRVGLPFAMILGHIHAFTLGCGFSQHYVLSGLALKAYQAGLLVCLPTELPLLSHQYMWICL